MTVTNIPQKSIVRQNTKPTAPQAGLLWYDTNANILKQFKNGGFEKVGQNLNQVYDFINQAAGFMEKSDLQQSLNAFNYDDGFVDSFFNSSKVDTTNSISLTTGTSGNFTLQDVSGGSVSISHSRRFAGGDHGVEVEPSQDIGGFNVTLDSSNDEIQRVAIIDRNLNVLADKSGSFFGGDTIKLKASLKANTKYFVKAERASGTGQVAQNDSPSLPISGSNFDVTAGYGRGSRNTSNLFVFSQLTDIAFGTSGSLKHVRQDLGFTPSSIVVSPDIDLAGQSATVTVSDNSGNSRTVQSSEFGNELSVNFNDGNIKVEYSLSGNGASTPKIKKTMVLGVV